MILNKDWSAKLNGYFITCWSHFWLPYKSQPNKIKVEREHYMKHMVIDSNDANELVMFSNSNLETFSFIHSLGNWKLKYLLLRNQTSNLNSFTPLRLSSIIVL